MTPAHLSERSRGFEDAESSTPAGHDGRISVIPVETSRAKFLQPGCHRSLVIVRAVTPSTPPTGVTHESLTSRNIASPSTRCRPAHHRRCSAAKCTLPVIRAVHAVHWPTGVRLVSPKVNVIGRHLVFLRRAHLFAQLPASPAQPEKFHGHRERSASAFE